MKRTIQIAVVALLLLPGTHVFAQDSADSADSADSKETTVVETTASSSSKSTSSAIKSLTLGKTKNVHRSGNLFLTGQFRKKDLAKIKEEKIERIISLRSEVELDWDEKAAVESAGLEFVEVPFKQPETLTDEVFDRIRKLLADSDTRTLLHCNSANRAGVVWLPYRVLDQGIDLETALAEAAEIGLGKPFMKEKALDYIKRQQVTPEMGGEESVKPGVNNSFTNPELDVDAFVKRFEIESREVFLTRERILVACEIEKGDTVADVGAGTGLFSRMFSTVVGNQGWVYAVDISPRFLEHINKESARNQIQNISAVLCAENSVSLPPNSVDVVFICDVYHHFEYPKSTLATIYRALKPNGHMIVIDFERIEGESRAWTMGHVRAGKEVFRAEIRDAGFKLAEEKQIDGFQENYFLKFRKD